MEDHPQTSSVSENITSLDEVINKMSNVLTLDDLLPAASAATDADTVGSVVPCFFALPLLISTFISMIFNVAVVNKLIPRSH